MPASPLTVIAPAKVNLYLHVTGRRDDGYHLLDSLVVFADVADQISFYPASQFSFAIEGPYTAAFTAADRDYTPTSRNLAVRAAYACAAHFNRPLDFRLVLTKNLPLASGIGGGSADAAAVVWGIMRYWGLNTLSVGALMPLLLGLGADVPACYLCQGLRLSGIGEKLTPYEHLSEWPAVMVNPRQSCPTPEIFKAYKDGGQSFSKAIDLPDDLSERETFLDFLHAQGNDLQDAAMEKLPIITEVMNALRQDGAADLIRMSGSGATVFALYTDTEAALQAAETIQAQRPGWWVRACTLNRVVRY